MRIRKQPRQLPVCRDSFLPMYGCPEGVHSWREQHSENGAVEEHHVAKVVVMSSYGHGQEEEELLPQKVAAATSKEVTSNGGDHETTKMLALVPAAAAGPSHLYHPESSFTQEDEDEDNLTRRHYVRRGLQRNGVTLNQCAENVILPVDDDPIAAIPKVTIIPARIDDNLIQQLLRFLKGWLMKP